LLRPVAGHARAIFTGNSLEGSRNGPSSDLTFADRNAWRQVP